jgi:hypothetical protein
MAAFIQNILVVFPRFSNAETSHQAARPTTGGPQDPIYFYDSDKPYFELAQLSSASRSVVTTYTWPLRPTSSGLQVFPTIP